ncbi:MAG TPA: zinc-ribbon domain-containing protein [Clostridia bacterium]|nr:zinc-ribbon domain-containing protein [Clostridia bacterium]
MMNVLCEHCGKEIPGDSKFCRYCGQVITPLSLSSNEGKVGRFLLMIAMLLVCVITVLGIRQMTGTSKQAPATPAVTSSAPAVSEYHKNIAELYTAISQFTRHMISDELFDPSTLNLNHDWSALTNEGIIIVNSGTAEYVAKNGKKVTEPFEALFVLCNDGNSAYNMALKLGDTIVYDRCDSIDEKGIIVSNNMTFNGRGYGELISDSIINPSLWEKGPGDNGYMPPDNSILTLASYQAIQIGMAYDQVCQMLGGPGVELSRSGTGKKEEFTVVWSSQNNFGASITVAFKGGKAISKVQFGLQ